MSTAVSTCSCSTIGAPKGVRLCDEHHFYWDGDRRLTSVSSVIRETWPLKKSFEAAAPDVLEHARERGDRVDKYVSAFVTGGGVRIPAGEWQEVVELVQKFVPWWQEIGKGKARAQVLLHDDEIAGTCDIVIDGGIWDLKTTYSLDQTYHLQLGLYGLLYQSMYRHQPESLGIIQLTKRFREPQVFNLNVDETMADAATLLHMWRLVQRRANATAAH